MLSYNPQFITIIPTLLHTSLSEACRRLGITREKYLAMTRRDKISFAEAVRVSESLHSYVYYFFLNDKVGYNVEKNSYDAEIYPWFGHEINTQALIEAMLKKEGSRKKLQSKLKIGNKAYLKLMNNQIPETLMLHTLIEWLNEYDVDITEIVIIRDYWYNIRTNPKYYKTEENKTYAMLRVCEDATDNPTQRYIRFLEDQLRELKHE